MRPRRYLPIACTLLMICPGRAAPTSSYAQALSRLPRGACLALAGQSAIGPDGAIGRNRRGYFHVRFQLGLHHWADEAIAASDPEAADRFRRALDYALAHETPDGGFELQVPRGVSAAGPASQADLASGSAFFLSSAGAGLLALKGSAWFQSDPGSAACRRALSADEVPLRRALGRLKEEQRLLDAADANAPNRLLFDALAFISLGEALGDAGAVGIGRRYESSALALQAPEGYFIEGGGFDSSYNGVALAVGYRLLLIHPQDSALEKALRRSLVWQRSRIAPDGSILTRGNSRVAVGGERFLGQEKQVDAPHCLEALELASVATGEPVWGELAERVLQRYRRR